MTPTIFHKKIHIPSRAYGYDFNLKDFKADDIVVYTDGSTEDTGADADLHCLNLPLKPSPSFWNFPYSSSTSWSNGYIGVTCEALQLNNSQQTVNHWKALHQ